MTDKLITIAGDVAWDFIDGYGGPYLEADLEAGCLDDECSQHRAAVRACAAKHGVDAVMVDENGPGGGHPVYEFTGTRAQLEAFVIEFYDAGQPHSEDVEFFFESAVEVD